LEAIAQHTAPYRRLGGAPEVPICATPLDASGRHLGRAFSRVAYARRVGDEPGVT